MIISEQIPFESILKKINSESVFIIGCNECAALCHVGGEPEVLELKKRLEEQKIPVTGWIILDPACHLLNSKRLFKKVINEVEAAKHLLVVSCGNGIQVVQELFPQKHIINGTNTLFLGAEIVRGTFERQCQLCGSCIIDLFEGLCPISHCPKQLLNGPCGGSMDGKCELGNNKPCIWDLIIKKKKERNKSYSLNVIIPPKDWSVVHQYQWREKHKL